MFDFFIWIPAANPVEALRNEQKKPGGEVNYFGRWCVYIYETMIKILEDKMNIKTKIAICLLAVLFSPIPLLLLFWIL